MIRKYKEKNLIWKIFSRFLFRKSKCIHPQITPASIGSFCPDCGKIILMSWMILRCNHCSTKRHAKISSHFIAPTEKYCSKCGSGKYIIEKKYKIEFYDLDYAILLKEEVTEDSLADDKTQVWIEYENTWTNYIKPKLIAARYKI